jgi:hypothetical protein
MERHISDKPFALVDFAISAFIKLRYRVELHELHLDLTQIRQMVVHATADALKVKPTVIYLQSLSYAPEIGGVSVAILVAVPSNGALKKVSTRFLRSKFSSWLAISWRDHGVLAKAEQITAVRSYDIFPAEKMCECVKGGWKHVATHKPSQSDLLCKWYQEHCAMPHATLVHNEVVAKRDMKKAASVKHAHMMAVWAIDICGAAALLIGICWALVMFVRWCYQRMLDCYSGHATDESSTAEEMEGINQVNKNEQRVLYYRYCSTLPKAETMSYSEFCDSLTAEHTANAFSALSVTGGDFDDDGDIDDDEYDLNYDDDDYEPIVIQRPVIMPAKTRRRRKCGIGRVYRTDKGTLVRWTGKGKIGYSKPLCVAHHRLTGECKHCSKEQQKEKTNVRPQRRSRVDECSFEAI